MARLVVRLLGGFQVELDGRAIHKFESDKCRALLAYLVVEAGRPHRRETLSGLLWPDRPDSMARANLRQALSALRRVLTADPAGANPAPDFLFVTPTDVQFNNASDTRLDVADLEAWARHDVAHARARHEQLLPEVLCADFLAGFALPDSEMFQAWVLDKQEHYHRLTLDILSGQAAHFEQIRDYDKAVAAARLQLRMEPWLEEAHQRCMRALALAGRRDEALRQYEVCCRNLQAELGVEPSESSKSLHVEIRDGRLVAPAPRTDEDRRQTHSPRQGTATALRSARPTRLAGREDELGWLTGHLHGALAGETGVVFVSGDPGSGKTALLEAFAASSLAEHPDLLVAGARCAPGGGVDPFAPLRRLAEVLFGDLHRGVAWHPGGREEVERLSAATVQALACLDEQGPDLVGTLIPTASVARRDSSTGGIRGLRTPGALSQGALSQGVLFDQLLCTLNAIVAERPLLVLLDDLHWVDDATAAFLLHLGRELASSSLLVLGAYRPEAIGRGRRDPANGETSRHPLASAIDELRRLRGEIVLDLDRADGRAFVEAYVDNEPNRLGAGFRDALYAQTGGHALFTVELLRDLQERGELLKDEAGRWVARESLDWGALPVRVQATIAERIERLPEGSRRLLCCASVQGDDFNGEVVAELTGEPVGEVLAALSGSLSREHALVRAEGVVRSAGLERAAAKPRASAEPKVRSVYRFSHHLFQKYLYDGLDPLERARWHAAVAASLDRQAGDDPAERERISAQLAWHYEAGSMPLHAARALHNAGRQAMKVSALREALGRFDHALALLAGEAPSAERAEIERLLQTDRLSPQASVGGVGSSQLEEALALAGGAGARAGHGRPRLLKLQANEDLHLARGQSEDGLAVAGQMLEEATQCGDESFVANAHFFSGLFLHIMGKPREAESRFELAIARLTPELDVDLRAAAGFELAPQTLGFSALNRWILGYPEKAQTRAGQALAGAVARGDRYGQALASALGSMTLFLLRSDAETLRARVEPGHRLCQEDGIVWWQDYLEVFVGRLAVMAGHLDAGSGIERMRSAIAGWQGKGMVVGTDDLSAVLADGCLAAACSERADGRPDVAGDGAPQAGSAAIGLAAIEPFLGPEVSCGQSFQAELLRMRGELLLARDGLAAAEEARTCFEQALQLGQLQGALAWELRAAMSIVRLRERQGDGRAAELAEARTCLADVYGRFTEGFEFPDLRDAASLLGEAGCRAAHNPASSAVS